MRKISESAAMDQIFIAPPLSSSAGGQTTSATMAAIVSVTTKQICSAGHQIPSDILDDLASRFIINVPDDERNNLIRICFQIELAHWFYLDFFCSIEEKKLIPCGIKQFATHLFHHIPFLRMHLAAIDKILEDWKEYKLSVPTYGAILMTEDLKYVLLVQSYWAKSSWGFPKGKVNEHEDPIHCATREVYEETGYDITGLIVPSDYIEAVINYQYTRLYLVRNVPLQTLFSPRTRKEIKCCEWFPVDSLPTNKNDNISKANLGINANSFFMIMPFIKRLKKWVNDNRAGIETSVTTSVSAFVSNGTPLSTAKTVNGRRTDIKQQHIGGTITESVYSGGHKSNLVSSGKRQRHKSMGDIDGIRINVTTNSGSGIKALSKLSMVKLNNQKELNSDSPKTTGRERLLKANSKRQLFNVSSKDSSSHKNNFDSNCNDTASSVRNRPHKASVTCKSKSENCMNTHSAQNCLSSSLSAGSKISPNLDSWTSFTFTKNFIANVFC